MADVIVTPIGSGAYRVADGTRSSVAYAIPVGGEQWVFFEGRVYVVDVEESGIGSPEAPPGDDAVAQGFGPARTPRKKKRGDAGAALASPMPATVVAIAVEPGQVVATGDVLIMLEAMKMELPIKAPRDARVKAIACRVGELVQPGIPLLELE